ncbi:hypothetical protein [Brevundimonas sp.]|uniref:hypothetical protein n=1 Tax=Brevundimonas sp. TaxID=1871086 RepID=UPI002580DB7B|nr:hypothetical protein [Brevundimonas sp.]
MSVSIIHGAVVVVGGPHGVACVDLPSDHFRRDLLLKVLKALDDIVAEERGFARRHDEHAHVAAGHVGDLDPGFARALAPDSAHAADLVDRHFADQSHPNLSCVSQPGEDAESAGRETAPPTKRPEDGQ